MWPPAHSSWAMWDPAPAAGLHASAPLGEHAGSSWAPWCWRCPDTHSVPAQPVIRASAEPWPVRPPPLELPCARLCRGSSPWCDLVAQGSISRRSGGPGVGPCAGARAVHAAGLADPPQPCVSVLECGSPTHAAWPPGTAGALPVLCSWWLRARPVLLGRSSSSCSWKSPCSAPALPELRERAALRPRLPGGAVSGGRNVSVEPGSAHDGAPESSPLPLIFRR